MNTMEEYQISPMDIERMGAESTAKVVNEVFINSQRIISELHGNLKDIEKRAYLREELITKSQEYARLLNTSNLSEDNIILLNGLLKDALERIK